MTNLVDINLAPVPRPYRLSDAVWPGNIGDLLTDEQLKAIGAYKVYVDPRPTADVVTVGELEWRGEQAWQPWSSRAYTPQELDDQDEAAAFRFKDVGSVNRAILQAFFEHENRIRVLEAAPSVTIAQVYGWFKAKIRG